jgi:hypothetical protein
MADDNEFGPLFRAAVEQHVTAMSNDDFAKLTALRPPTDAASVRASLAQKASAMWETPRDHNGPTGAGSFAAAARARAVPETVPETEPQAPQSGFGANRAQGYAGSGTSPEPPRALRPLR